MLLIFTFIAALGQRLLDPDEKVRVAVCKVYAQLDYETSLHHVSEEQLRAVAGRAFDKKVSVLKGMCMYNCT